MRRRILATSLVCLATGAGAEPWLAPGDEGLRHDLTLLADAGILRGPVTTWPVSWPDVARDVNVQSVATGALDDATAAALLRVQRRSRAAASRGFSGIGYRASLAENPEQYRVFADEPREEAELAVRASWLTDHLAMNLRAGLVADPDDGRRARADGSYLGVNVGNFMISAGLIERWWGPGWDGSLILSSNARPIPSVTLERNYSDPFKAKLLSWLGPWRASIAVGQAEGSDVAVTDVRFMAARVNFKPRPWLEIGLSRTAQWCGSGRPCGLDTFKDMLIGNDNQVVDGSHETQPGNQMAGYDVRLRSPWRRLPVAVFGQLIGEDEAGGLPSKFLGRLGIESWSSIPFGSLRFRVEYADTACNFSREQPEFDCAYRNAIYPQGYRHRGRPMGESIDGDSRSTSATVLLARDRGDVLSLAVRRLELNRDGTEAQTIEQAPREVDKVEFRYTMAFKAGDLGVAVGVEDAADQTSTTSDVRAQVSWSQGF